MLAKGFRTADYLIPLSALVAGAVIAYLTQDVGDMVVVFFLACVWMELNFIRRYLRDIRESSRDLEHMEFERIEAVSKKGG